MRIALYITIKWWYMKIPVSELGPMIVCLIWDLINRWKRCSFPALLEYISYFYSRKVKTETKVERGYDWKKTVPPPRHEGYLIRFFWLFVYLYFMHQNEFLCYTSRSQVWKAGKRRNLSGAHRQKVCFYKFICPIT